jgi:hypothetical protein
VREERKRRKKRGTDGKWNLERRKWVAEGL